MMTALSLSTPWKNTRRSVDYPQELKWVAGRLFKCLIESRSKTRKLGSLEMLKLSSVLFPKYRPACDLRRASAIQMQFQAAHGRLWSAFLQKVGYYRAGIAKIELARSIATHMVPERNTSRSFRTFREGLTSLVR